MVRLRSIQIFLLFIMFLSVFSFFTGLADQDYLYHFCSNTTTTPAANLNTLLSYLSSNATLHDGFFNTTATGNRVYGLFLCRGDVLPETCQSCVSVAAADVAQRCPNQSWAIIWYEQCLVRYSNQPMFSSMAERPRIILLWNIDAMEPDRFDRLVATLLGDIATRASNSAKRFATKDATFTEFQRVYSLAQCTPDIPGEDCYRCLHIAIAALRNYTSGKTAGYALYPSCILLYRAAPFYRQTSPPAASPPSPPPPPLLLTPSPPGKIRGMSTQRVIEIVVPTVGLLLLSSYLCCVLGRKAIKKKQIARELQNGGSRAGTVQSLQFDLSIIEAATNNFAQVHKIGAGGFGTVFKGTLPNGEEIAVKRLSTSSGQGAAEFQTEVLVVARLQHRNLVKLLGYCLQREERMLIYEFLPNKSLDHFIFDPVKRGQLNWPKRYKIIKGIARGLLYLHSDSRVKIIHRDLKAGNILLDEDMTPKISDFGMARIVGENVSLEQTKRIVGTYGYMAPEYALHGRFSEKSDVFSFGVLILEIVCGKLNTSFCHSEYANNLLSYAWKHWKDGTPGELMDSSLQDSCIDNEVVRCIQIGLLCVQDNPDARPTMARVVLMLNSSSVSLPPPQRTAFFFGTITEQKFEVADQKSYQSTSTSSSATLNEASLTEPFPR